jgi:hypothetical protein
MLLTRMKLKSSSWARIMEYFISIISHTCTRVHVRVHADNRMKMKTMTIDINGMGGQTFHFRGTPSEMKSGTRT